MPLAGDYEPSPAGFARDQVDLYERSGGTEGTVNRGKPVIVLTTVGAKTGKLRKTPLMRVEHNGEYAAVASLGGAPNNPVWYYNLVANPHVELQDGADKKDYHAREVHGDEYAAWFDRAVAAWPDYAKYQQKTARRIPIFVLTPASAQELPAWATGQLPAGLGFQCVARLEGKKPLTVPSLISANARSRSNPLLYLLSSAMTSATPITTRAAMSADSNGTS